MFMGKIEWNNTLQLLKIRKKESKSFLYISILLITVFVAGVISTIFRIFNDSTALNYVDMVTYSSSGLLLSIITCIFFAIDYKNYNYKYEIYPSNNKTSFVSYALFCYILLVKLQIISLLLYVTQYGLFRLLNLVNENIYFVYKFNIMYLLTGFFITILYGFLIISFIIFVGSLNRKYNWLSKVLFLVFIVLCLLNLSNIRTHISIIDHSVINFIVKESNILIFIIKTTSICLLLNVLSILLNQYSSNNKEEKSYGYITLIACIGIFITLRNINYDTTTSYTTTNEVAVESEIYDYRLYKLNPSKAQKEYKINLNEIKDSKSIKIYLAEEDKRNYSIHRYNLSSNSDDIILHFLPDRNIVNKVDVVFYMEPQLDIKYVNNEIYLNVLYEDNVYVVFMEPYSMLKQFAYFKGKGILKECSGSSYQKNMGKIFFYVPNNIKMDIIE